jgi:hypothetical protein
MWALGKWVLLTHDELETIKDSAYQKGLRSKWRAKKAQPFVDSGRILCGASHSWDNVENLLSAVNESVIIPQREAA